MSVRRKGSDWHLKDRFVGRKVAQASGTVSVVDKADEALTAVAWELFDRIAKESENGDSRTDAV